MPIYGDQTIDNFSFAKCRFKNYKLKLVNIQNSLVYYIDKCSKFNISPSQTSSECYFSPVFYSSFFLLVLAEGSVNFFCSEITV